MKKCLGFHQVRVQAPTSASRVPRLFNNPTQSLAGVQLLKRSMSCMPIGFLNATDVSDSKQSQRNVEKEANLLGIGLSSLEGVRTTRAAERRQQPAVSRCSKLEAEERWREAQCWIEP